MDQVTLLFLTALPYPVLSSSRASKVIESFGLFLTCDIMPQTPGPLATGARIGGSVANEPQICTVLVPGFGRKRISKI